MNGGHRCRISSEQEEGSLLYFILFFFDLGRKKVNIIIL